MHKSIGKCLGLVVLCFIAACSQKTSESDGRFYPNVAEYEAWYVTANGLFIHSPEQVDIVSAAQSMQQSLVLKPLSEQSHAINTNAFTPPSILSTWLTKENVKDAAYMLKQQKLQQFIAHQFLSYGKATLSESDSISIQKNTQWQLFFQSLANLSQDYEVLRLGDLTLYEADNKHQLLAYSRRYNNTRAFIAYNLSFDVHEMPLPFGFMSSTKVTMWQSDAPKKRSFVTNSPLIIHPYTVALVIVG